MKRIVSLFLAVMMLLCVSVVPAFAVENDETSSYRISTTCSEDISFLVSQHLRTLQKQIGSSCTSIGFDPIVFMNMTASSPFTVYTFDKHGEVISDDVYMSLLMYSGEVVGTIGVYYDSASDSYQYSLGTNYADEMNSLLKETALEVSEGIIIGRLGDKLFATDGSKAEILFEYPMLVGGAALAKEVCVDDLCSIIKKNAVATFCELTVDNDVGVARDRCMANEAAQPRLTPNPIPILHVNQTGLCGAAAWASVLNYRFSTNYTNYSLEMSMLNGGYANGTDGDPCMTDYRDYANDQHNAGCVYISSPPSFSTVITAIGSVKPIMGSWYSGSGSDKVYHAIVITGYVCNSWNSYTYYVKNPWYQNATTITISSSSNVVYVDGPYTWNLLDSVY